MDAREALRIVAEYPEGWLCADRDEAVATLKALVPKRYVVMEDSSNLGPFIVRDSDDWEISFVALYIQTREVAERIAAIYEEAS